MEQSSDDSVEECRSHINIVGQCCLLCRHQIEVGNKVVAILGTALDYGGYSTPFEIYPHDRHPPEPIPVSEWIEPPAETFWVFLDGERHISEYCDRLNCSVCKETSAGALIFHLDCGKLLKVLLPSITYSDLWRLGAWCRPWFGENLLDCSMTVEQTWLEDALTWGLLKFDGKECCDDDDDGFRSLLTRMTRLPPELRDEIVKYSQPSVMWRLINIFRWKKEVFDAVQSTLILPLRPRTISSWTRDPTGSRKALCNEDTGESRDMRFFRMGIDALGVRFIEYSSCRPTSATIDSPSCLWYVIEEISYLESLNILTNGYFLFLDDTKSQIFRPALWNEAFPPDLDLCRNVTYELQPPERIKSIDLSRRLTGLSVFCSQAYIYGMYAHRSSSESSVIKFYKDLQEAHRWRTYICELIFWLYFPLHDAENIDTIWIRQDKWRPDVGQTVIVHTSLGRVHVFGTHLHPVRTDRSCRVTNLGPRNPCQFFYNDHQLGEPIWYLGAYSEPSTADDPPSALALPGIRQKDFRRDRRRNHHSYFYSSASLENVARVRVFYEIRGTSHFTTPPYAPKNPRKHGRGMLITYVHGRREAVGHCGLHFESEEVSNPVMIYWRELLEVKNALEICASTKVDDTKALVDDTENRVQRRNRVQNEGEQRWHAESLQGIVQWWFDSASHRVKFNKNPSGDNYSRPRYVWSTTDTCGALQ